MAKVKLTKGELKKQRDALRQYERYLPTLQLKKQQLQIEILHQTALLDERRRSESSRRSEIERWTGLLSDSAVDIKRWTRPRNIITEEKNVAGVDIPIFLRAEFADEPYDLYLTPFWTDHAIESLKELASLRAEEKVVEDGIAKLRGELRVTTQRVNLFEKVKIPEAKEAIRRIKIYIGDQMANAVGRSKIAKRKIELVEAI